MAKTFNKSHHIRIADQSRVNTTTFRHNWYSQRSSTISYLFKMPSESVTEIKNHLLNDLLTQASKKAQAPLIEKVQPYVKLNDGSLMPMLGLGTWNAQGKELKEAIKYAIYAGYRHIDTASNYRNEELVGEAINECISENIVQREDLFVTTKLWNNSHSRGSVVQALNKSLKALNLRYVDLYLIHYPIGYKEGDALSPLDAQGQVVTSEVDYVETWLGMEDAKRLGLTRSIGVSNFNIEQLSRILYSCSIPPTINQVSLQTHL